MEGREVGVLDLEGAVLVKEGLCFKMEGSLAEGVVKREAGRDGRPVHKKEKAAPPHLDPLMINKTSL